MSGTTPDPPPTSSAGVSASHTNQPPIGPRTSSTSPTSTTSCEEARHLAVGQVLDGQLDLAAGRPGAEATEYEREAV